MTYNKLGQQMVKETSFFALLVSNH